MRKPNACFNAWDALPLALHTALASALSRDLEPKQRRHLGLRCHAGAFATHFMTVFTDHMHQHAQTCEQ